MINYRLNRKSKAIKNIVSNVLIGSDNAAATLNINTFNVEQQAKIIVRLLKIAKFEKVKEIFNTQIEQQTHTREGFSYAVSLIQEVFYNQFERGLLIHLNKWIERDPHDSLAYTARAYFYYMAGWIIRGTAFIPDTPEEQVKGYVEQLNLSSNDVQQAIELDATNPLALLMILILGRNGWASQEVFESYFTEANAIVPYYLEAYQEKSGFLNPKWHGKNEEDLLNFIKKSVRDSPRNTALPLLLPQVREELSLHQERDRKKYYNQKEVWYEIETNYLRLIEDFPDSGFYPLWFAQMARDAGKNRLARKYYALATKKDLKNLALKQKLQEFKRR